VPATGRTWSGMLRFLSPAWIERLADHQGSGTGEGDAREEDGPVIVLRQVVTATPEGVPASYDVVVSGGTCSLRAASEAPPDLTVRSSYDTACSLASGRLSAHAALASGLLRLSGDLTALARVAEQVGGIDPLPADLRAETEFP